MYKRDVEAIKAHVFHQGPDGLVDVLEFVLCTIQAGLSTVKMQRQDIAVEGFGSRFLWGQKGDGLAYTKKHKEFLWGKVYAIAECGYDDVDAIADVIELFMAVPNLGMVKAAFVAQCLGFNVACIDSHNLKRLGMSPQAVKVNLKAKRATIRKKVVEYVLMTQQEGSEYWWDSWCEYVAGNRANKELDTGDIVSRFHVDCITMKG